MRRLPRLYNMPAGKADDDGHVVRLGFFCACCGRERFCSATLEVFEHCAGDVLLGQVVLWALLLEDAHN